MSANANGQHKMTQAENRQNNVREWCYRVVLKGTVFAVSAEEAEELAMDAVMEGDAEDDEVEVERA